MPDHWHGLIELGDATDVSSVIRRFKSVTAFEVNSRFGSEGPVWQRGFHDHALRKSEAVTDVLRYLVANPVRAGLCRSAWSYPYWDVRIVEAGFSSFDGLAEFPSS